MPEAGRPHRPVHSRPGALFVPEGSPPPRIRYVEYDEEVFEEGEIKSPEELRCYAETERPTWVDIEGFGDVDCLLEIGRIFGIHTLALADAVNVPQRAKTQRYPEHWLIVVHAPLDPNEPARGLAQVCILLAKEYVVTFQERNFGFFDEVRERLRNPKGTFRRTDPSYLAYALVDAVVDQYFPALAAISTELDEIESRIFDSASPALVARVHGLQRQVTHLLRVHRPQVDAIHQLVRSDHELIPAPTRIYFGDVEDHARQIQGGLEAARDSATDAMSAILATLGHRQNEVMKVLTLVGTIFIPLTFIVGIYGMNFDYMPELRMRFGYPAVMGGMLALAVAMLGWFRWKGWLGGSSER